MQCNAAAVVGDDKQVMYDKPKRPGLARHDDDDGAKAVKSMV